MSSFGPEEIQNDQHCQYYGCTQSHNLQIHHIKHWADGGSTGIENGVCLCVYHHSMVHEGGYFIQKVNNNEPRLKEQFVQQQHANDTGMLNIEKSLRNDRTSFNTVRQLTPTRYRFRIVDTRENDIRDREVPSTNNDYSSLRPDDSTRVE